MKFSRFQEKQKIAKALNLCESSLATLLNVQYFEELEKLGYKKTQKQLSPMQCNFLRDEVGLNPEDFTNP